MRRTVTAHRLVVRVPAGHYRRTIGQLRIARSWHAVARGARVFPRRKSMHFTIHRGRMTVVRAAYGTIVNPHVAALSVVGDPANPEALVYGADPNLPAVGSVLTAPPSALLPYGLVAQVTASTARR